PVPELATRSALRLTFQPTVPGRTNRIRSIRVEALLGLGQIEAVEDLLRTSPPSADDVLFHAARGIWFAEIKRYDEAYAAFVESAEKARAVGASDLVVWTETQAAGTWLDRGQAAPALPRLEKAAASLSTEDGLNAYGLQIHWAEYYVLLGEQERALSIYEKLLESSFDVETARRAYVLAKQLGQREIADRLFTLAEQTAQRILAAGEIYALETLARLYADAGVKLARAEELATRNLEWKRDRKARETLEYVRSQRTLARNEVSSIR
ncbi:MAG: hypothetical protein ACU843_17195, partial [Gammaproteobacteria bacterium]